MPFYARISDSDVPDRLDEEARAAGIIPSERFEEVVGELSEAISEVEDGDEAATLAYCVAEVRRTIGVDGQQAADSADVERTEGGKFDLRNHTKIEDD